MHERYRLLIINDRDKLFRKGQSSVMNYLYMTVTTQQETPVNFQDLIAF